MRKGFEYTSDAAPERVPLFSVTVRAVVGTVYADETGTYSPRTAAFILIAESGQMGTFEFPTEDGNVEEVTVVNVDPESPARSAILDVRSGRPTSQV